CRAVRESVLGNGAAGHRLAHARPRRRRARLLARAQQRRSPGALSREQFLMLPVALLLLAADPQHAAAVAPASSKPKLLVLDFQDQGVGENAVKIVHDTLAAHLSKDTRLDVISTEDM